MESLEQEGNHQRTYSTFWCSHQIIYVKFTYVSYLQIPWCTTANVKGKKIETSYFPEDETRGVTHKKAVLWLLSAPSELLTLQHEPWKLASLNTYE